MLDPVAPAHLRPAFDKVVAVMAERGGLDAFRRLDGRVLIALDCTEYFRSQKIGCPQCLTRKRANGKIESYHAMLAATIGAPGHATALPLMPTVIAPRDGAEKQDCERAAVKRRLATHGERMKPLRPVFLGDDLFACQPIAEAIRAAGGDVLLTAKPTSHKAIYDFSRLNRKGPVGIAACARPTSPKGPEWAMEPQLPARRAWMHDRPSSLFLSSRRVI